MERNTPSGRSSRSLEKVNTLTVHWTFLNQPSPAAIKKFNRILATAQQRVYASSLANK